MREHTSYDVAIVGYGPVGQTLAALLAARGHSVAVYERFATLYDLHPGYLKTPTATKNNQHLAEYIKDQVNASSYWAGFPAFIEEALRRAGRERDADESRRSGGR